VVNAEAKRLRIEAETEIWRKLKEVADEKVRVDEW
jgi:hypothetical protein